ncbi:hexosaminidase [Algoriphagus ratkowskyi]|uniref:beta-N-acetylhexosaminidase n=1 Tax=Algoriphagus ratkowskyi TaxID=57028 RepID=A0A2W7RZ98_9BACT|nr:beta-N-acetylhexosaminidase [Algoriphagus ratkowskyi]PZX60487.1 hexosaminidase [Algoriphagus ratkowskyi]TXD78291.1 beta-N-acetylhexosaminidase [Algoriphagus ratkowskyi]
MKIGIILISYFLCFLSINDLKAQSIRIIPQPNELITKNASFTLNSEVSIIASSISNATALTLQKYLQEEFGFQNEIIEAKLANEKAIVFRMKADLPKEGYELIIDDEKLEITASNSTGWFYGVQSLKQLLPQASDVKSNSSSLKIPAVSITDSPRFAWRAFMLDEARYFKGMEQVKMLLDEMALLKMNVFHWHLVDDQGWRIEIKKYPLLTEVGSKRKSTQVGPLKWASPIQSAEPHEGFYTQEQIKEIIKYAQERHITIVPEIEMPGHSSAAIAAYPWLGTVKKEIEVPILFGVGTDVYDVSDPKVYKFLTDVLDEVIALFPSKVIHIGGDEVKYNHWKESDAINAYMKEKNLSTPADLQIFFTNSISRYLNNKGNRMMGWNEIMGHNLHEYQDEGDTESNQRLAEGTIVHFWKGDEELVNQAVSSGYEIVNSLHTNTYLDYDYGSIPLSKAYAFDPIPKNLDAKYHSKVIGTGSQMWGEWIPTNGHMHFLVFPRIAAFAEVGWTETENKNYDAFKIALKKLQKSWEKKGIYYAPDSAVGK